MEHPRVLAADLLRSNRDRRIRRAVSSMDGARECVRCHYGAMTSWRPLRRHVVHRAGSRMLLGAGPRSAASSLIMGWRMASVLLVIGTTVSVLPNVTFAGEGQLTTQNLQKAAVKCQKFIAQV